MVFLMQFTGLCHCNDTAAPASESFHGLAPDPNNVDSVEDPSRLQLPLVVDMQFKNRHSYSYLPPAHSGLLASGVSICCIDCSCESLFETSNGCLKAAEADSHLETLGTQTIHE